MSAMPCTITRLELSPSLKKNKSIEQSVGLTRISGRNGPHSDAILVCQKLPPLLLPS